MSMDKHQTEGDIKVLMTMTTITLYIPIKRVLITNHPVMRISSSKESLEHFGRKCCEFRPL
jgi:hypothetical protein